MTIVHQTSFWCDGYSLTNAETELFHQSVCEA